MLLDLILEHMFISLIIYLLIAYYSFKGYSRFNQKYKRSPIYIEYTIMLLVSCFVLLSFDPRPNSHGYGTKAVPSVGTLLFGIGVLIVTSIRFALLLRDYNIKTALYITAVNFSIAFLVVILLIAYSAGEPEREKKRKEEEEKRRKEEEAKKKRR